ncbi:RNA polymerase sigma factor [Acinetobacter sp.]|uniref:RNA polymerase sigma factor n=1 Tax=Acinetobacter sp. TaxID=472 RepID=UPI0025C45F54|nr:RNA polymerase sigma factor [Acinetobacter sp.]
MSVMFRNICIDYWRNHSKRIKREVLISEMEAEWETLREMSINTEDTTELTVCVDAFLASLSDLERQFAQYLMEDTSYQDIADEMKISVGTVRSRIHRYRARWQEIPQLQLF